MSQTMGLERAEITIKPQRRWMFTAIVPNSALTFVSALIYFALDGPVWAALIPFVWFYVAIPLLDAVIGEDHLCGHVANGRPHTISTLLSCDRARCD